MAKLVVYKRSKESQHIIKPEFLKRSPFQFVKKYKYTFDTYCKKRWLGKKLLDILSVEFSSFSQQYYETAIEKGYVTINKTKVSKEYILQESDFMEHTTVRLEPPVLNIKPEIIYEDNDIVVVNKPPSYLVHAGAGANFNTLQGVLIHELDMPSNISFMHRLDKFTSGLVIVCKTKLNPVEYHKQGIEQKEKIYLARVYGEFPQNDKIIVKKPIYCDDVKLFHFACCEQDEAEQKNAKSCETHFKRIWYDQKNNTSLVECVPLTGRTHQIRVHLSDFGFPILNDLHYGGKFIGNLIIKHHWPQIYKNKSIQSIKYTEVDIEAHDEFEKITKKIKKNNEQVGQKDDQTEGDQHLFNVLQGYQTQKDIAQFYEQRKDQKNQNQKVELAQNNEIIEKQNINGEENQNDNIDNLNNKLQNDNKNSKDQEQQPENENSQVILKTKEDTLIDKHRSNDSIEWNFRDHVLELYLHSYQYKVNNKSFKTNLPYWADKDLEFIEGFK